ncbi:hypothetical protein FOZ60_013127 [Perkinsus olseni]|uniref:Uncharacterized protein n=1 Tax=Perkinsus olseni TaxID=32597 RepID=A0A7J6N9V8_PEROL|nr:hypothetical protein FOZ60_013127 [Perkinsus olseni]
MLSVILAIGALMSVNDALSRQLCGEALPGRVKSPFLSVDCTFVPRSGVSSVHMVVGCDEQKPAAVGRLEIKPSTYQPNQYVITDLKNPSYMSMITELQSLCPRRFVRIDFTLFERVKGRSPAAGLFKQMIIVYIMPGTESRLNRLGSPDETY